MEILVCGEASATCTYAMSYNFSTLIFIPDMYLYGIYIYGWTSRDNHDVVTYDYGGVK